jgi:4-aminobutyrate aminotransferase-like enzyme/Ser/Thr protein kinase RdoA (MazF antagonist)/murein DD-endopeptidase MepM/ murein hydrolase activator NlpD
VTIVEHSPLFTTDDAQRIASERYGHGGRARQLTSERDQNFLIEPVEDAAAIVVKIANALEERALLEAQQQALALLAQRHVPAPRVVCTMVGEALTDIAGPAGRKHFVWAITHLPGVLLADVTHQSPELLEDLGATIGRLTAALRDFDSGAVDRDFHWDLTKAADRVAASRPSIADDALGNAIDATLERVNQYVTPPTRGLTRAVIHNDLNGHNILVASEGVSGILDFGDMLYGWRVADLAIAAAYAMLDVHDPLAVLASLVRGAQRECPLEDVELEVLFELACLRLALSTSIAVEQQRARPDNGYLGVSQEPIRRTLPQLVRIPHALAAAVAREAAGREPIASSARVREWLRANAARFAPVLDVDLRTEPTEVLDLGVASPLVSGDPGENVEAKLTPRIDAVMRDAGVRIAVGRYDEPRLLYTAPFFGGPRPESERRTIHIGLDLFAAAGTPVLAPLDGIVHAFANNAVPQDYGPVVILRHETTDGNAFFTLYGHLSRASLDGLAVGRCVAKGERFAWLGAPNENLGWTPHLHLQIITDLLGWDTDFPGVAPASQRAVWRSLSPDPNLIVGVPANRFPATEPERLTTVAERRQRLAGNLSIAYRSPVKVERGWMQYLYDDVGRQFVDAYNNVPHVGHCHPRVVRAGHTQMAVLNTNTRYPSDLVNEYAARVTATLPGALRDGVVYLVSSASEANELALRLARAQTGERDMIVLEAAYHGNTTSLIDISPYKHGGPGGTGAPDWVHVAPLADDYRGPFKRSDPDAGAKYALPIAELIRLLRARGRGVAGFIAESCPSVGGQIVFPPGYLGAAYATVRAAGGVCVADEVQTGLGRIGTHFWAFEAQGVVPDIVVMGKPLGNGHPLAAVVARREIAESFDNGMEYFSTFGGNQVSCAIGLAVLDVVRDEQLQAHARRVGEHMLNGLRPFVERHALVGDVRGSGLFLGVELVRDRQLLEPADREASYVVNRMRDEGILLGTDGPYHNVVKIRPPMPFDEDNADRLVETFDRVLRELE